MMKPPDETTTERQFRQSLQIDLKITKKHSFLPSFGE